MSIDNLLTDRPNRVASIHKNRWNRSSPASTAIDCTALLDKGAIWILNNHGELRVSFEYLNVTIRVEKEERSRRRDSEEEV